MNTIGCDVGQICKSLIFKTEKTNKPVLILASGPNRVNEEKIIQNLEESLVKGDADFVREITGFPIGGVAPIGHSNKIEHIFIDNDLLKFDQIWAAAGTSNAVFCLKSIDLVLITKGQVIEIK